MSERKDFSIYSHFQKNLHSMFPVNSNSTVPEKPGFRYFLEGLVVMLVLQVPLD